MQNNNDNRPDDSLPVEQECGDCVFFRNGSESDFCALTMGRVECYERSCYDFEMTDL
jgi:hypothetical protein